MHKACSIAFAIGTRRSRYRRQLYPPRRIEPLPQPETGSSAFEHLRELAGMTINASASKPVRFIRRRPILMPPSYGLLPDAGKRFMTMIVIDEIITFILVYGRQLLLPRERSARAARSRPSAPVDQTIQGPRASARAAGRGQGRATWWSGQIRSAELGSGEPKKDCRCADSAGRNTR